MYRSVSFSDFAEAFKKTRPDNFSPDGLRILFDTLTHLEVETGEQIELDVIALCCDYQENTLDEINEYHKWYGTFETLEDAVTWLYKQTTVFGHTENIVVFQRF